MTPKEAQRRDREKQPYTVIVGDAGHPDCYVEVAWDNDYLGVWFLDEDGRRWLQYAFARIDDTKLFLDEISMWKYPDGGARALDEAVLMEEWTYTPEGIARHRVTDYRKNVVTQDEYSDVPLDINWEPVPPFGEYEGVSRAEREPDPSRR